MKLGRIIGAGAVLALLALGLVWLTRPPAEPPGPAAFVRAEGRTLVRNGAPFRFSAIGFSNHYTLDLGEHGFSLGTSRHHSETDFERLRALGFNAVRFAFNGRWALDDPRTFWRWLDRNVGWAKKHGVLLILDLHVPIGGVWLDPTADTDFRIWTDPHIRAQNVALWRQIAERYRDEPAVGAYDILNEAVTADATGDQWRTLARDIAAAIREVDPNHLIIVGALYGTGGAYEALGPHAQFLIDDDNAMYDFHFYEPVGFTHQGAHWLARPMSDGGRYPDPERITPTGTQVLLADARIESPRLTPGSSGWQRYESPWQTVRDPAAVAALPIATMRSGAAGTVHFDHVEVFERDPASGTVRRIVEAPLDAEGIWEWWEWHAPGGTPPPGTFGRAETFGKDDTSSLKIDGTAAPGAQLGWSSDALWFRVKPGHHYKVSGHMTGARVRYTETAEAPFIGFALDVYAEPAGPTPGFLTRGRAELEFRFLELYQFGIDNDVPISVMEFGTMRGTFETPGKGGGAWVADMLDIFAQHDVSFSLWNYHGPSMGLYLSPFGSAPSQPNRALFEVLETHLAPG